MTRKFLNFGDYSDYYDNHEHKTNDVDIVENELTVCADGEFTCQSWKVALRRFFKALNGRMDTQGFDEQALGESINSGYWKDAAMVYDSKKGKCVYVPGGYHWCVESTGEGCWYVEMTVGK